MNSLFARHNLTAAVVLVFAGLLHLDNSAHAQGGAPAIIAQPHGQTVTVGMNATFHVSAFGRKSPVRYQWRFNNSPILNATNNSYTRFNVQLTDAGNYSVAVTSAFGTTVSANAVLTVNQSLLYWDIDGAIPGPGGISPSGSWADASWSPSSSGGSATTNWVPTSTAFFAAGTAATDFYTVSLDNVQLVTGINFEEGTVTIAGSGELSLTGNGSLSVAGNLDAYIFSIITGNGSLIKAGTGTLYVSGENSYAGETVVSEGTLLLENIVLRSSLVSAAGSSGRIPDASAVTVFDGATLDLSSSSETIGSLDGSGTVELGEGSLTIGANHFDSFFDGNIEGFGPVTKIGFGTLTLAGDNNFLGFFLNGGAVEIANEDALGVEDVTVGSGFSEIIGSVFELDLINSIFLEEDATANLSDRSDSEFQLSGTISGPGALSRGGDDFGVIILSGGNSFSGGLAITGGALEIGNSFALGSGLFTISGDDISNPVVLKASTTLRGKDAIPNPVSLTRAFTIASADEIEFAGPVSLNGSSQEINVASVGGASHYISGAISGSTSQLSKTGPGTLTLLGDSDYSGLTVIRMGTLRVENFEGSATGNGPVNVGTSQGSPSMTPPGILSGSGAISGPVSVFGTISPGSGPGEIFTGSQTWNGRGHYRWEINAADGGDGGIGGINAAGGGKSEITHDSIRISGRLTITASPGAPFHIDITTLTPDNIPGDLIDFDEERSYAWRIARTTDGVFGFNPSALRINSGTLPVSHGSFTLAVENDGLDLVLRFDPDTDLPTVAITFPEEDGHTTDPFLTIEGTASDNLGVSAVLYQINEGPFMMADGTTTWFAQVPLSLGTNTVTVKSVDNSGNESMPVTRILILDETAQLTIEIVGDGSVTPNLNGQFLVVGQSYSVRAVSGPTNAFSAWSGGVEFSGADLTFVMEPDLVLRATFVPAILSTGTYNGLFYEDENLRHESSGFFTFKLSSRGSISGKLLIDGGTHRFSGKLDDNRGANFEVTRRGKTTLNVSLIVNPISDEVSGQVGTSNWTARVLGDLAFASGSDENAPQEGTFTMSIPGQDNDEGSTFAPLGDGYGTLRVDRRGAVRVSGRLSDDERVSQSTSISRNGVWPFYESLYRGQGSIIGWITFTNRSQSSLEGNLSWIKMGGARGKYFPDGFTNSTMSFGSTYVRPESGMRVLNFTQGRARFQDGNLEGPFSVSLTLSDRNKLTASDESTNRLSLRFSLGNGYLRGSFVHPVTGKKMSVRSVVLQKSNEARGYFIGTDESGSMRLRDDDDD